MIRQRCPRCRGNLILDATDNPLDRTEVPVRQNGRVYHGRVSCLACGWEPNYLTPLPLVTPKLQRPVLPWNCPDHGAVCEGVDSAGRRYCKVKRGSGGGRKGDRAWRCPDHGVLCRVVDANGRSYCPIRRAERSRGASLFLRRGPRSERAS